MTHPIAPHDTITVIQVFRALGISHPSPTQSWSVGNRIAAAYRTQYGVEPMKAPRPKTDGHGSHCFAIYPGSWRERIEEAVRSVTREIDAQGALF